MNESPTDNRLADEVRALREEVRKGIRNALWIFSAAVILVCLVFGPELSSSVKEGFAVACGLAVLCGFLYLIGLCFQAFFNARLRKRYEKESFALLSGQVPVSHRGR